MELQVGLVESINLSLQNVFLMNKSQLTCCGFSRIRVFSSSLTSLVWGKLYYTLVARKVSIDPGRFKTAVIDSGECVNLSGLGFRGTEVHLYEKKKKRKKTKEQSLKKIKIKVTHPLLLHIHQGWEHWTLNIIFKFKCMSMSSEKERCSRLHAFHRSCHIRLWRSKTDPENT